MHLNRNHRAALMMLTALAAAAHLTACGGAETDEPFAEPDNAPVGGVNADSRSPVTPVSPEGEVPEDEIPEVCPEPQPLPEGIDETFQSPAAETLCDLPLSPDRYTWHLGYRGRAVAAEDLGAGRFRFTPDGGEFQNFSYNPDCDAPGPHLVIAGLGTTGLAVGDAVRLDLSQGLPAPEDGDAYDQGRIFLDDTGALVAAWGGNAGGYPLRDGGPELRVGSTDTVCATRNPGAQCAWSEIRHSGATVSAADDTVSFFGGLREVVLDGATFLVAASVVSYSYNYDCDPGVADNSPVNQSRLSFRITRWVR
jgi:hypothetical protein